MPKRLSLAQQIADLDDAAPVDFDPDDLHLDGGLHPSDDGDDLPTSQATEHYLQVGPSSLRKLHDSISDPKYDGVRTSRKRLMEVEEADSALEEDEDADAESGGVPFPDEHEESASDEEEEREDEDEDASLSDDEFTSAPPPQKHASTNPPPATQANIDNTVSSAVRKTREEDLKKGKAVTRQLAIWDALVDARIRLQKTVTLGNRLPVSNTSEYAQAPACNDALEGVLSEALALCEEVLDLRESLMTETDNLTPPPRKKRRLSPTPSLSAHASYLTDLTNATVALNAFYAPHARQTLEKWTAKIQAVAPSTLLPSNRNAFSAKGGKGPGAPNGGGLRHPKELVEEAFGPSEVARVLARTRATRGGQQRIGQPEARARAVGEGEGGVAAEVEDVEVFDDAEFYQQLLRDVIESKGASDLAGVGGAGGDWAAAQKARKARKKVDTKASKGRKLRFEVHEKLRNFMVPIPAHGGWHAEQIDELFASLLGKGFEEALERSGHGVQQNMDVDVEDGDEDGERRRAEVTLGEALKGGFRVFG